MQSWTMGRVIGLVAWMCTVAAAAPDVEPTAAVTARVAEVTKSLTTGIERIQAVPIGEGSTLQIATPTKLIGAAIEIEVQYTADTRAKLDDFAGFANGWATAEAIKRATKLKGFGAGSAGSILLSFNAVTDDDLVAAVPKIIKGLTDKAAPAAKDLAGGVAQLETMTSRTPMTVPPDGGLHRLLFTDPPISFTLDTAQRAKLLKTLKSAAIVDVRKRMRTGHVRIAIAGTFTAAQVAKMQKAIKTGLASWKPSGPIARTPSKPAPRAARTELVAQTGFSATVIAIGQVMEPADDAAVQSLELACAHNGPINTRIGAITKAADASLRVSCSRAGRQVTLVINLISRDKHDKLADDVKAALVKLVADGPTAAEHAEAQLSQLAELDTMGRLGQGPQASDMLRPPAFSERIGAAKAIAAVKRADVHAALKANLDPTALVTVIAGP